ncbi:MAG: RNA polymerase sigma factor [Bacteroidales bacterium]|nr:RNA polymerase sigma factor [Bacteroidales bacterium]
MTDLEYIEGLKKGDETSFRNLVEEHQLKLLRLCNGFVHSREDALDLVQEVFIEVYRSIHSFRGDSGLSTWLYRVAVNKSLNFIRKQKRKTFSLSNNIDNAAKLDLRDESGAPDVRMEQGQRDFLIQKALDSLQENQRIAFILNKYDDLSYKEISGIMDVSLSAVESLIHRAKTNLQKKLYRFYKKNLI